MHYIRVRVKCCWRRLLQGDDTAIKRQADIPSDCHSSYGLKDDFGQTGTTVMMAPSVRFPLPSAGAPSLSRYLKDLRLSVIVLFKLTCSTWVVPPTGLQK
jgi:hypothetical protein